MSRWYDQAVERLEKHLERGEITHAEFREELRELNAEIRGEAEEAAERAYNDTMGNW